MRQIKRKYATKTPEKILLNLETFVERYDRLPTSQGDGQEYNLYRDMENLLSLLPQEDPVAVRIEQLQHEYGRR